MFQKCFLSKNFWAFLLFIILSSLIFALDQDNFLSGFKRGVFFLTKPLLKVSDSSSFYLTEPLRILVSFQKKREELENLEQKQAELKSLKSQLIELERENDFLREVLALQKQKKQSFLPAQVIGRTEEINQVIMVDVGEKEGLEGGEAVILPNYFLVGKVTEVLGILSQVILINSPNFSSAVRGQTTRTEALLSGAKDHLEIEIVDHRDEPEIGEVFITSGLDGLFPPGLIVGKLLKVVQKPTAISKIGWLEPAANLRHLEKVLILVPSR